MSDERFWFPWEWSRFPTITTPSVGDSYCGIRFIADPLMPPRQAEMRGPYGRVRIINLGDLEP